LNNSSTSSNQRVYETPFLFTNATARVRLWFEQGNSNVLIISLPERKTKTELRGPTIFWVKKKVFENHTEFELEYFGHFETMTHICDTEPSSPFSSFFSKVGNNGSRKRKSLVDVDTATLKIFMQSMAHVFISCIKNHVLHVS